VADDGESVTSTAESARGSCMGELKSFGRKRIDTGGLVFILLKLPVAVLDE
jgi:hypothetical protein